MAYLEEGTICMEREAIVQSDIVASRICLETPDHSISRKSFDHFINTKTLGILSSLKRTIALLAAPPRAGLP